MSVALSTQKAYTLSLFLSMIAPIPLWLQWVGTPAWDDDALEAPASDRLNLVAQKTSRTAWRPMIVPMAVTRPCGSYHGCFGSCLASLYLPGVLGTA